MVWALIASLALFSGVSPNVASPQPRVRLLPVSTPPQYGNTTSSNYAAILQILLLANQAREQAGVAPLQLDSGLTQAAQAHADEMAAQRQLSHELPDEAPVPQRLAADSSLHLDSTAENVAYANSVELAEQAFMNSPPHRANLLNSGYNVAGIGVATAGDILYVVQDFGHSVPAYSEASAEDRITASLNRVRAQEQLPELQRLDGRAAQQSACSMAKSDSLKALAPRARYVVAYANSVPDALPGSAARVIADPELRGVSVGSCFARTTSYPSGVYWVALLFY